MTIPTTAHWQPALEGDSNVEGVEDIRQCIRIIIETPVGSVPLEPEFGSKVHHYVDWPIDRARPHVVRETVEAIAKWEKRCIITRVQVLIEQAGMLVRAFFKLANGVVYSAEARP